MDCPEKWELVGNALVNLQQRMLSPRVLAVLNLFQQEIHKQGFEKGLPFLYGHERKERAQATLTARRLTRGEGVLEFPEIQAVWLILRCQCASDFLGQMFPPLAKSGPCVEVAEGWTPDTALEWVLTELWERRADTWLKLVAMEWAGPFPFYGIEPAPEWT
jgi:hypothetical protein